MTGRFGVRELAALIGRLSEGVTEFMCHPGYCTGELRQVRTRLKQSRHIELEALTSPEIREALERANVVLVNYRTLSA
jgi:predicted glycoside hydrolase/deacetylase ChbG (UPF0249 family)